MAEALFGFPASQGFTTLFFVLDGFTVNDLRLV